MCWNTTGEFGFLANRIQMVVVRDGLPEIQFIHIHRIIVLGLREGFHSPLPYIINTKCWIYFSLDRRWRPTYHLYKTMFISRIYCKEP